MSSVLTNHHRPNLSDQITRLDHILDGLAEALNEAVGTAVRAEVGRAVRNAIAAELSIMCSAPTHRCGWLRRTWSCLVYSTRRALSAVIQKGTEIVRRLIGGIKAVETTVVRATRLTILRLRSAVRALPNLSLSALRNGWEARRTLASGLTVGAVAAALTLIAGPAAGAMMSGSSVGALVLVSLGYLSRFTRRHEPHLANAD